MREYACTEERFLKDVERHTMTVLRDDGVHRHIRFKRPNEGAYWFDLITWPGTLCIDGDCGTYVFRRLEDMFEFFRTDRDWLRDGATLGINPSYWGEKLQATASYDGYREFSEELFKQAVKSEFDAWVESEDPSDEHKEELWDDIENRVLGYGCDGAYAAVDAAMRFEPDNTDIDFEMRDFYEHRLEEYTFHFIWCCYAIAWGVKTYDEAKAAKGAV